jgi:hypothetical protein
MTSPGSPTPAPDAARSFRVVATLHPRGTPDPLVVTTGHAEFTDARRAGLHLTCLLMTASVDVYAPDGTVECTWRAQGPTGERDNQWHSVGPHARADDEEFAARMALEMQSRRPGRSTNGGH